MAEGRLILASLSVLIVATATYVVGAQSLPMNAERPAGLRATQHVTASPISPHFVMPPRLSRDNGALCVNARIAGLGETSVSVVVSATAVTTCANGPAVQEVLTAARPAVFAVGGIADFSISTEPVAFDCPDGITPRTQFRNVILSIYQNDEVILERVFNRAG